MSGRLRSHERTGRLPAELTTFLGRGQEVVEVRRLLSVGRLVTLTGVGGTGKTRLAAQVAAEVRRGFPDGAWLVDLAVQQQDMVEVAVADVFGLADAAGDGLADAVLGRLRDRRLLLLLDNCEHVLDGCADFAARALRAAPDLRILCTSRQPLGITGEYVWRVPPLRAPEPGVPLPLEPTVEYPSMALFAERATAVSPDFAVTPANQDHVAMICAKLDGLPLAIELAAARLRTLSVDQLVSGLGDRLSALAARHATPAHHRTLEATFDWSFALCSAAERALWARLSVFTDGVDLEAASYVCGADVLDPISGLVDKSVLLRQEAGSRVRYRLLETVREYGRRQLRAGSADELALRCRHRDWYLELTHRLSADWFGPRQLAWVARMRPERGNIRSALEFCLGDASDPDGHRALTLAANLEPYWLGGGGLPLEGRYWLARILDTYRAPTAARAWALATQSRVLSALSASDGAPRAAAECVQIAEALGDPELCARAAGVQAVNALVHGTDLGEARVRLADARERLVPFIETQAAVYASVLVSAALVTVYDGDRDRALELCAEGIAFCSERGDRWWLAAALIGRGLVTLIRGDLVEAENSLREALRIRSGLGDLLGQAITLDLLATVASRRGDHTSAARTLGAAAAVWRVVGDGSFGSPRLHRMLAAGRAETRAALGEDAFEAAFRIGQRTPLNDPARVLTDPGAAGSGPGAARPSGPLTRREQEVAALIAQGLSNREIATKMTIAVRTAESHVENILRKLQFTTRAQVAVWYAESAGDMSG
jgi:predicted ATPase/DNA-binding CsgD family transcriptional regulator